MQHFLSKATLALSAGAVVSVPAYSASVILDFSGNICDLGTTHCFNGSPISQHYGDIAGQLDVSYRATRLDGSPYDVLRYSGNIVNGASDFAWGGNDSANYRAEITFDALAGYSVSLDTLTFASFFPFPTSSTYTVRDLGTHKLLLSSDWNFNSLRRLVNFSPSVSSNTGLVLTWGPDSYSVGLDQVSLTVSPTISAVPEPETYAMMLAGLGLLGFAARRRK